VKDRSRDGRPTFVSNDEKSATILQSFIKMPNTSARKVATENEVSQSSVYNILKKHKFHPYEMLYVQEMKIIQMKILTGEQKFMNLLRDAEMIS